MQPQFAEMVRACTDMMRQMTGAAGSMTGMGGMMGMMPGAWWMWLQMLLFWGVLIAVAVAAIVLIRRPRTSEPLTVLQTRYARGEISTEEYQQVRRILEG